MVKELVIIICAAIAVTMALRLAIDGPRMWQHWNDRRMSRKKRERDRLVDAIASAVVYKLREESKNATQA